MLSAIFRYWDLSYSDIWKSYGYLALHNDLCSNHCAWMLLLCILQSRKYWVLQANFYPGLLALTPSVLSVEEEAMVSKGRTHYKRWCITRVCRFSVICGMPSLPLLSSWSLQAALRRDLIKQGKQRCRDALYCIWRKLLFYWGMKKVEKQMPSMRNLERRWDLPGMSSQFFEVLFLHRFTCFCVSNFLNSF